MLNALFFILGHIGLIIRLGIKSMRGPDQSITAVIGHIKHESGVAVLSWLIYVTYISMWVWSNWLDVVSAAIGLLPFIPDDLTAFPAGELNPLTILLGLLADVNLFKLVIKTAADRTKQALGKGKKNEKDSAG